MNSITFVSAFPLPYSNGMVRTAGLAGETLERPTEGFGHIVALE
jgi:hypothetical protein